MSKTPPFESFDFYINRDPADLEGPASSIRPGWIEIEVPHSGRFQFPEHSGPITEFVRRSELPLFKAAAAETNEAFGHDHIVPVVPDEEQAGLPPSPDDHLRVQLGGDWEACVDGRRDLSMFWGSIEQQRAAQGSDGPTPAA